MSNEQFLLPAFSRTIALSRNDFNSSLRAISRNFYGQEQPLGTDFNDEGSTGTIPNGVFWRDSINGRLYIKDTNHAKPPSGGTGLWPGNNFTRYGIATSFTTQLSTMDMRDYEIGELVAVVNSSDTTQTSIRRVSESGLGASSNNRLYMKVSNGAAQTGLIDVGIPYPGSVKPYHLYLDTKVEPITDATVDFGDWTYRYRDSYFSNGVFIGTSVDHISLNATGGFLQLDGAQFQDGTQAAPSITFEDDTDTGIFREGTDDIGFTTGGTKRMSIDSNSVDFAVNLLPTTATIDVGATGNQFRNMYASGEFFGTATTAKYADLAEKYTTDEEYPIGTVMMVSSTNKFETEACSEGGCAIGVISENPAFKMNADTEGQYIGLKGRLPIRIIGEVTKGSRIFTSSSGVAKAEGKGMLVGVALESNSNPEEKLVECVLKV
jgi:hypothetical protein